MSNSELKPTIECDVDGLAKHVKEFVALLPQADTVEQVENMLKAVNLAYLGCCDMFESELKKLKAVQLFDYANSAALKRMGELVRL